MILAPWLSQFAYAIVVVVTIISMLAVLMDNRQPVKTMAWLLLLGFFPVGGVIIYIFFGRNTRKQRYISQRSLDQLSKRSMLEFVEQKPFRLPDQHAKLVDLFANQSMSLPFKNSDVDIYTSGSEFFPQLLKAIASARHHIHLVTYIFANDALGRLVADMLCDKAREGIEVRLIYDDVGCWRVPTRFFEQMRRAGVEVQAFIPVRFPALTSKVNYRNHRKICVIDGNVGFIGGMNIALRYLRGTASGRRWRDTHMRIRGGSVYALQRTFLIDWYFVDRTLVSSQKYYPPLPAGQYRGTDGTPSDCMAQVVTSSPVSEWPDIMQGYVRILLEAKHYVYMETPYFLPTEPVLFAMRTAALAGVDVRLMVPRKGDAKLVEWAGKSYLHQALEAGVKVYYYDAGFNHSKLLVSDDSLAMCGSTNIDIRSFEKNFEANIFFYDEAIALRLKKVFEDDMKDCTLLDRRTEMENRPFFQRLWESLVRMLSPLL